MGTITSGIGLVSGINSKDIIDQLISIEERPKNLLKTRIEGVNQQKLAYTELSTRLTGLRLSATNLQKPSFFQNATANSSDEGVITATASKGAAVGSYQFQVARLVTSQQLVGRGFKDPSSTPVGAGQVTIEVGGGEVTTDNNLADLLGGQGISRGLIRITDRSGTSAVVDTTDAVTLDDVIKKINTSLDINVKAEISGDTLRLTDRTGKTTSKLSVQDVGTTTTAADLGLAATAGGNTLTGTGLNNLGRSTNLATLGDGRGLSNTDGADLRLTLSDGTKIDVDLASATTVGDAIDLINTAAAGKANITIPANGKGFQVKDLTNAPGGGGGAGFSITSLGSSTAASDLGLDVAAAGKTLTGDAVLARVGSVLVSSLNGGRGFDLGTISIKNRSGTSTDIDLSGAKSLQTAIDLINNSGAKVTAGVNSSGNGLQLTDTSNGGGTLVISDKVGTTAKEFGLSGTYDANQTLVKGANLQRQWLGENTLLSTFNGGKGAAPGRIKISASDGTFRNISIDPQADVHAGDVLAKINAAFGGKVVARINDNGDGLQLADAAGGTLKLKVEELDGSAAAGLNIKGEAAAVGTGGTINGSFEKTIDISATDTLADVQSKINTLGYGVSANIINDGSTAAPYRLSLNARGTGRQGRVTFDAGTTNLDTRTLVQAQDAAVFVGSSDAQQPLLITASSNSISGVIRGVNIDLHGVSDKPVTINVARDSTNVTDELQKFTDTFNELEGKIKEYTKFDTDTLTRGILLGDGSAQQVETTIYSMLNSLVTQGGKYKLLSQVGLRVGQDGLLSFDKEKFASAYADDEDGVAALFSSTNDIISRSTALTQLNRGTGVQTTPGKPDFQAALKDGTRLDVVLGQVSSIGDVIDAINAAAGDRLRASLTDDGQLAVSDLTTGAGAFTLTQQNGSQALFDLKLGGQPADAQGTITGIKLVTDLQIGTDRGGGLGTIFQDRINKLIDPVNGLLTRSNKTLDQRTDVFQSRIDQLDVVLEKKRTRLQTQFANLESVLSGLQNQQQALGQISNVQTASKPSG